MNLRPWGGSAAVPSGAAGGALAGTFPNPRLRDTISLRDYTAGTANDDAAVQQAINDVGALAVANGGFATLLVPPPASGNAFYIVKDIAIASDRVRIAGMGGGFKKRATGAVFIVNAQYVEFDGVHIEGNGTVAAGNGITCQESTGFKFTRGRIYNVDGPSGSLGGLEGSGVCIDFTAAKRWRTIANSSLQVRGVPARGAIRASTVDTANADTQIIGCFAEGGDLVDFSGWQNCQMVGCSTRDVFFDDNSVKIAILGSRLATIGGDTTVKGTQHAILGNVHAGGLVLAAGATGCVVSGNVEAIHDTTDNSGNPGSNMVYQGPGVGVSRYYDRDLGQAGVILPGGTIPSRTGSLALSAQRAYLLRFRETRRRTVTGLRFLVRTAAGADDSCDVALYSSDLVTKHASAGSTAGKLNAVGWQTVNFAAPFTTAPGVTYYAVLSTGAFGGAAAVLEGPDLTNNNAWGDVFGAAAGVRETAAQVGLGIPIAGTLTPAQSAGVPFLVVNG